MAVFCYSKHMRIIFFGDSITQGFWSVDGGWVERVRKHYDARVLQGMDSSQPAIFNVGISGDTTRSLLTRIESETKARIWKNDPIIVVIAIGTNDDLFEGSKQWVSPSEFRANLQKIVDILKPLTQNIVFVGNPACDEAKTSPVSWGDFHYTNAELERSEKAVAEVAVTNGLTYIPIFEEFKTRLDNGDDFLADGLHPNDAGHQFIADRVLPILQELVAK